MALTLWRKSSFSGGEGTACVEVAWSDHSPTSDSVLVRDSKNPTGPVLSVSSAAWQNLLATR
ncbi:DUF397 domain-containing protein [Actinokineospora inagensis]|uniref:DUF397 domain-containing protein n=1 Tax=Actinokineospora inagensis TaxID=103730 RepID=UPI000402C521|nr:DUF397 domain-containing protein [Actinokineospora inagensis]